MKRFVLSISMITVIFMFLVTGCQGNAGDVAELSSIKVTAPDKTDYLVGEELDKKGLIVEAVFSDETTKDVTEKAVFSGFDKETEGTQKVTVSYTEDEITKTAEFTVTVFLKKFKITFDANGGSGTMDAQIIGQGRKTGLTANKFTKPGYIFAGWSTKSDVSQADFVDKENYTAEADITLYAVWNVSDHTPYTVEHYQQNIGNNDYTLKDTENLTGTTFTQTVAQAKTYPGFTSENFEQSEIAADGTSVVKIYYKRNEITIRFNFDGGTCNTPTELKVRYGTVADIEDTPTKAGEMFKDWNPKLPETFTEDGNYTATWRAKYTVNFNINSTDAGNLLGTMNTQTYYEDNSSKLTKNAYKNFGLIFDSWNTKADGSGISYTDEQSISVTADTTLYAQWKVYKILPATETGTQGISKRYVLMGLWPQTLKAESVTIDENVTKKLGMYTYYLGSDDEWYAKQLEEAYDDGYTYSDGITPVGKYENKTYQYFKVEPVKWCELTKNYAYSDGDTASLLLAENELTANVTYYDSESKRTIDGKEVCSNNYKYSKIRAYLNGRSYWNTFAELTTFEDAGFLQTAFTDEGSAQILTTKVVNDAYSTTDTGENLNKATSYICDATEDKIFLLSEQEVTTTEFGFESYNTKGNKRLRLPTDFAKANKAYRFSSGGGKWWLRSPSDRKSFYVHYVGEEGKANSSDDGSDKNHYGIVPALCIKLQ